jgi:hypothetical protein
MLVLIMQKVGTDSINGGSSHFIGSNVALLAPSSVGRPSFLRDALRFLFVAASLAFALTSTPTIDTKPNETEQVICIDRLANNNTLCPQAERLENVLKSTIQIMILSRAL